MSDLYASIYNDYTEDTLILSTSRVADVSFSTQLPGGFAEGSLILPSMYFSPEEWRDKLLGRHLVITDEAGSRVYEGSIEGIDDGDSGLNLQASGYYAKAALKTTYLAYPTTPINLISVLKDGTALVREWRSSPVVTLTSLVSDIPLEFLFELKVQDMIEKIAKEFVTPEGYQPQFAVYDHLRPFVFENLTPWFKVSKYDMTLKYGSTVTLSGTYNKIQVLYEDGGLKYFTNWYEDIKSQQRYGVREGSLQAGQVPEGIAKVAGELALPRYKNPDEQPSLTINGMVRSYHTSVPTEAYWLRAGHMLFVADMPANPESRFSFRFDRDMAGFLVVRTSYSHRDRSLSVDVGDGVKTLEQYLADMGITGGNVR